MLAYAATYITGYAKGYADAKKSQQPKQCPIETKVVCVSGTCETTIDHCTDCKRNSSPKTDC